MEIVVNEWLLEHLRPDAKECDTNLAFDFIRRWMKGPYKVVIRRESPFTKKLYRYMKESESHSDLIKKRFVRLFKFLLDSDRTIVADECDINNLPQELEAKTPHKDKYLIELAYSKSGRIIVTTDTKLKEKLQDEPDLKIYLLEEFLQNYPVQN